MRVHKIFDQLDKKSVAIEAAAAILEKQMLL